MPFVSSSTIPDFFFINLSKSKVTSLHLIPQSSFPFTLTEFSYCSEACNIAFEGIQPTFKQVPPKLSLFSILATFIPF